MPSDVGSLLGLSKALMAISTPLTTSCSSPTLSPSLSSRFRLLLLLFVTLVSPANADSFYFKIKPKTNHVEEGHSVRLKCLVSDNKHIEYRWTLNHSPLELDTRRRQQESDLVIQKVDAELDNGKFRCVATNKTSRYSLQSKAASVKVFYMSPNVSVNLVEPSRLDEIVLGGPLELKCGTTSHPPVSPKQITWYVNFQRLKVATATQLGIRLLDNGNLRILKTKPGNVGVYRCKVLHPAGEVMTVRPFPLTFGTDKKYNTSNKPEDFIKYVKKGDDIRLVCQPFSYGLNMHFMRWTFTPSLDPKSMNLKTIANKGSCKLSSQSRGPCILSRGEKFALLLRRVKKVSETGFYECSPLPRQSKPFVIQVRLATNPRLPLNSLFPMSRPDRPVVVVKGKDLTIRLYQDVTPNKNRPTVPDPEPEYKWFRPYSNTPVPDYSSLLRQRIYKTKGRYLNLKNAREDDSGVYRLWISNLAGVQKINVTVVVAFKPKFTDTSMADVLANEDRDMTFKCNVLAMAQYPVAKIIWFKDNSRIPATNRLVEDDRLGKLTIRGVAITDEGTYNCAVYTEKLRQPLSKSNLFRLRVRRTLKILNPLKTKFVERGKHMRLPCTAQGEGVLYVSWWLNRHRIPSRPKAKNNIWANKGDLVIPSPIDKHAGNYTCIVSSREQGRVNNTVQVIVGERPAIRSISTNLTVPEGRSVTLNCEATGDPRPKISWLKRYPNTLTTSLESITQDSFKESSRDTRRVMLSNGSLLIRRAILSDAAFYGCLAANPYALNSVKQLYLRVIAKESWAENGRDSSWSMTKTIIIVVGCAVAYLALIIGLTIYCSVRMLRNRQKRAAWAVAKMEGGVQGAQGAHENGRLMAMPNGESQGLMSAPDGGIGPGHGDSRSHFSSASAYTRSLRAGTPNSSLQDRMSTYPRHQLQTLGMLGKGEFGDVFLARAHNIRDGETESLVVVKAHHNGRSDTLDYEFHQQMDMCAKLDHDFVVKLLGVCREMEPEFMILEYCEWGDLKQFLKAMRQSDKECNERNVKIPPLTASQKVTMCSQVALGMEHLSNYRYVHKDLAARNVLLTSTLDLKISNLGLCQDVYAGEYFPMRNKRLPLRWLPSEVILEDAYSTKSDVWAFGILVYEVFTLGDIPHRRLTDLQVINAAESHYLVPELPAQCPAELASLLRQCWTDKPRDRPSFNDISVIIGELTVDSDI